jgi:hypothetical protein
VPPSSLRALSDLGRFQRVNIRASYINDIGSLIYNGINTVNSTYVNYIDLFALTEVWVVKSQIDSSQIRAILTVYHFVPTYGPRADSIFTAFFSPQNKFSGRVEICGFP